LRTSCAAVDRTDPDIKYICACDDDGADTDPHQMVQGQPSFELVNNADEQIVQCLKHVRHDFF
jgi:hypothetical protein